MHALSVWKASCEVTTVPSGCVTRQRHSPCSAVQNFHSLRFSVVTSARAGESLEIASFGLFMVVVHCVYWNALPLTYALACREFESYGVSAFARIVSTLNQIGETAGRMVGRVFRAPHPRITVDARGAQRIYVTHFHGAVRSAWRATIGASSRASRSTSACAIANAAAAASAS